MNLLRDFPASRLSCAAALLLLGLLLASPADAQDTSVDDVFGNLGTSSSVAEDEGRKPGEGSVIGTVYDGDVGTPIQGVTVIVIWPTPEGGGQSRQELQTTDVDGTFEFPSVPPGKYSISFVKSGYRAATMENFEVVADQSQRADFPLPPLAAQTSDRVMELEAFVVEASTVDEMMQSLELRLDSDQQLNIMSAEDFSKFAAGDVASALKRVAGVNVVEGQFAIIRGLEDRYSSTLYNGAVVPSPDPDRQSVQLDLFPSDIVDNLVVSKTFGSEHPGNSSGGSIDVLTTSPSEEDAPQLKLKFWGGTGFNENAQDNFTQFVQGSSAGQLGRDPNPQHDFGMAVAGNGKVADRAVRYRAVFARELEFETREGFQEGLQPRRTEESRRDGVVGSGDLAFGELTLSDGRFDFDDSERVEQNTGYVGFGMDLDKDGHHRLDGSFFRTRKKDESVQRRRNGFFPNLDYSDLIEAGRNGEAIDGRFLNPAATFDSSLRFIRDDALEADKQEQGAAWFSSFGRSQSFERERELEIYQLNGDQNLESILPGLSIRWSANNANTKQSETSYSARYFYEPTDVSVIPTAFPTTPESLGPGAFWITPSVIFSSNQIDEDQRFGRVDLEYEASVASGLDLTFSGGAWYERAKREVTSTFLEDADIGGTQFAVRGETELDAALDAIPRLSDETLRIGTNDSTRDINAMHFGLKSTIFDKLDLLGGYRFERISIVSNNDPFIDNAPPSPFGGPRTYPARYVLFDCQDTPEEGFSQIPGGPSPVCNSEQLGIDSPRDENGNITVNTREAIAALANGEIDERRTLPSFGFTYRATEQLTFRGSYSQTVARPSFREMGYYVSVDPGSSDLVVGNPQLKLSDVESFDARVEFQFGDFGDLFAFSAFSKRIENPIESLIVRDPLNNEDSSTALFRTFFNNPNEATLRGIEVEARKSLGFLGWDFLNYLSIGGNFTYIDAEVERTATELQRATFFTDTTAEDGPATFQYERKRRLFGQPEWIANADISFDHPDWGTRITLAWFGISDVLDAAGSSALARDRLPVLSLDEYIASFQTLDLIMSQRWSVGPGELAFKVSVKNLTDSERGILYDAEQTRGRRYERRFRVGRDFSSSITYEVVF